MQIVCVCVCVSGCIFWWVGVGYLLWYRKQLSFTAEVSCTQGKVWARRVHLQSANHISTWGVTVYSSHAEALLLHFRHYFHFGRPPSLSLSHSVLWCVYLTSAATHYYLNFFLSFIVSFLCVLNWSENTKADTSSVLLSTLRTFLLWFLKCTLLLILVNVFL